MPPAKQYWLVKTEPESFSIQDLARSPRHTTGWSGVRNYQARNYLRDSMRIGDEVLFYHSNCNPPAVVGTAVVTSEALPDPTAWDKSDSHFDPKSTLTNPIWQMVEIRLQKIFKQPLPLETLRGIAALKQMELLRKGSRLSVQPVRKAEYEAILKLAESRHAS